MWDLELQQITQTILTLGYYNLAAATGGSSGTICSTDYTALLDNIATQAAGSAVLIP